MKIILLSLFVKLLLGFFISINADEAYYWIWSHHLQLSYFDHPPFVAWLFFLGHPLENLGTAVRWPGILMAHGTIFVWSLVFKEYLTQDQLKWWIILAVCSPFLGIGALFITPDTPLLFFWSLSAYFLQKILSGPHLKFFLLLGASLGLGFLSKYHTVLFVPLGIYLVFRTHGFSWLWIRNILLSLIPFFLFSLPVWIWNMQNEWASFAFQMNHGLGSKSWDILWTIEFIAGQLFILFPFIILQLYKNKKVVQWPHWAVVFSFLPILFFLYTSLKNKVEANWPSVSYPYFYFLALLGTKNFKWIKYTCFFWAGLFFVVLLQISFNLFKVPGEDFKTNELDKFDSVKRTLTKEKYKNIPLFARTYQMASKLSFDTKKPIYKLRGMNRKDFYDSLPQSLPDSDYYVILKHNDQLPQWAIDQGHKIKSEEDVDSLFKIALVKTLL